MSGLDGAAMRRWVLEALSTYVPLDERCAASADEVRERVATLASPFDEEADPVHVTASGFVVSVRGMVLLEHRRLGIWVQPGGHVDAGEVPPDAAVREAIEETGLTCGHLLGDPTLVRVDVHPGPRGHTHLDLGYLLTAPPEEPRPPAGESQHLGWYAEADAVVRAEPALAAFVPRLFATARDLGLEPSRGGE